MSTKTPIPPASSTSAASRRCSSSRADKLPSRWSARSRATRSRKPFSATSCNHSMPDPNRAGNLHSSGLQLEPAPVTSRRRCHWAMSEVMIRYHDEEWGVHLHDDRALFEFLILEGAQAGLSWETVLRKRDRYREVFDGFDAQKIGRYDAKKVRA